MKLEWMGPYRELVEEYIRASNHYARNYRNARMTFEGTALSAATVQVLEYILENEDQMQPMARLAERLGVTRGAFSKIAAQLCQQGLVEKHHPEENSKEYVLTLTDKGRRVYEAYTGYVLPEVFAPVFAELDRQTPEQLESLLRIFRTINKEP